MTIHPSFTDARSFTSDEFSKLRLRALFGSLLSRLRGKRSLLKVFDETLQPEHINRRYLGLRQIEVRQVVGTLDRQADFDARFRPLGRHLRNRWVNTYLSLERDGWSPILVHQIGNEYFVEDGHHRVSIARSKGMHFVDAIVWEYSQESRMHNASKARMCAAQSCCGPAYAARSAGELA